MAVRAVKDQQGRVRTGRVGAQGPGGGGSSSSPVLFTYDFIANPSLPTGLALSRATIGTNIDTSGIRQSAAIDAARFDCDWDGAAFTQRGLTVEEQRSNVVSNSNNPNGIFANVGQCSWSVSSTVGADNSTFMGLLTQAAGATGNTSYARSGGQPFLIDIDLKKSNWNYVTLCHITSGGSAYSVVFDLVNGISGDEFRQGAAGVGAGQPLVRQLRNNIFRCGFLSSGEAGGYMCIGLAPALTGNTFDSVGVATGTWAGTESVLVGATNDDATAPAPPPYHASLILTGAGFAIRSADLVSSSGTLATQLAAGPSVWEMEDRATGVIARTQYAAGAFNFPAGKRYRSFGVYPSGTNTTPYTTVGGAY